MSLLSKAFGPSYHDVWQSFSEEAGGSFERGGMLKTSKVRIKHAPFTMTLEPYTDGGENSTTYTWVRVAFRERGAMRFNIGRRSFLTKIATWFGGRFVATGHPAFDEKLVLKGEDEAALKAFFSDTRLCDLITAQRPHQLSVGRDKWVIRRKLPDDAAELRFVDIGLIKDPERLKKVVELIKLMLDRLVERGVAAKEDVGVVY